MKRGADVRYSGIASADAKMIEMISSSFSKGDEQQRSSIAVGSSRSAKGKPQQSCPRLMVILLVFLPAALTLIVYVYVVGGPGATQRNHHDSSTTLNSFGEGGSIGKEQILKKKRPSTKELELVALLEQREEISQEDTGAGTRGGESSSSSSSTAATKCDYDCQTDRMGHVVPLLPGQAICNEQFRFGLTRAGIFQWEDCDTDTVYEIFNPYSDAVRTSETVNLRLQPNATLQILGAESSTVFWSRDSNREHMQVTHCLSRPYFDCPYFHLHKPGNVVFNYIDSETGKFIDRKIQRVYNDLGLP